MTIRGLKSGCVVIFSKCMKDLSALEVRFQLDVKEKYSEF